MKKKEKPRNGGKKKLKRLREKFFKYFLNDRVKYNITWAPPPKTSTGNGQKKWGTIVPPRKGFPPRVSPSFFFFGPYKKRKARLEIQKRLVNNSK